MTRKASPKTTTKYDFQKRLILAMATEMVEKKKNDERLFVQFEALAKSAGVNIVLE